MPYDYSVTFPQFPTEHSEIVHVEHKWAIKVNMDSGRGVMRPVAC